VTTVADTEHSLVVVEGLIHSGATTIDLLADRYAENMEHWPNSLATDLVLGLADGRTESVGETRSRYLFWSQHLPMPEPQYEVRTAAGHLLGTTDFAWPAYKLFAEFDGRVKYQRYLREGETVIDAVLREKRREQAILEETGWRMIRLVWADLYRPQATATRIRRLMQMPAAGPFVA